MGLIQAKPSCVIHARPCSVFLPEDIIEQILVNLRCGKSIVTCTSVCKSWYSLIKSSKFIHTHLNRPNNTKYLFCKSFYASRRDYLGYSLHSDSAPSEVYRRLVFPHKPNNIRIHGCCNGVICYSLYDTRQGDIFLWNPTIRKLRTLPRSRDSTNYGKAIGFWFDKDKNDHMIVKLVYSRKRSAVDVYRLISNSWKTICNACPGAHCSIKDDNLVYAEGTLHWMTLHDQLRWRIVSLDMNNAVFRETLLSRCSFPREDLYFRGVDAANAKPFYILGKHDSNCVHDLGWPKYNNLLIVGFRNNGEALFRSQYKTWSLDKQRIVAYDFGTKQTKIFGFFDHQLKSAHPFVESLVLLNDI